MSDNVSFYGQILKKNICLQGTRYISSNREQSLFEFHDGGGVKTPLYGNTTSGARTVLGPDFWWAISLC